MALDMRPYTKEGLEREQQQSAGGKGSAGSKGGGGGGGGGSDQVFYPDAYYHYKLAGVLVHTGTADSGHYYSYIKQRECTQARVCGVPGTRKVFLLDDDSCIRWLVRWKTKVSGVIVTGSELPVFVLFLGQNECALFVP